MNIYLFIKLTFKELTSIDGNLTNIKTGDVYKEGDDVYARKHDDTYGVIPSKDSQNWLKIN